MAIGTGLPKPRRHPVQEEECAVSPRKHMRKYYQQQQQASPGRLLITVSILGSPGPFRLLVNEEDTVVSVIQTALDSYACQRRIPVLGCHPDAFILYCATPGGYDSLLPSESIGSAGARSFTLCGKKQHDQVGRSPSLDTSRHRSQRRLLIRRRFRRWKVWLKDSFGVDDMPSLRTMSGLSGYHWK